MKQFPLIHQGSVKNIHGDYAQSPLLFHFSNRYSIFDWGEMPDHIEKKGEALAAFTTGCFTMLERPNVWRELVRPILPLLSPAEKAGLERFESTGMSHHFLGKYNLSGQKLGAHVGTDCIGVLPFKVLRPPFQDGHYDYALYNTKPERCLIPLEAIFRFALPEGSSLLKRLKNPEVVLDLNLDQVPVAGAKFERPLVEFSTKLEPSDRMLRLREAEEISGCGRHEFENLNTHIRLLAYLLQGAFARHEIELQDGKFEFGFGEGRQIILLDAIGPDELRLEYRGMQLSKEVLRRFYRKTAWFQEWESYKKKNGENQSGPDWKKEARAAVGAPPALPPAFKKSISNMYCALANVVADGAQINRPFPEVPELGQVARSLQEFA
ncbi:MAG: hypothetical protein A2X86_13315 [Bdellovibrionales bacterium GWA2_49_15]|nr:MAG: hypothetical protein A2X86_13315 [Bdellovibrionales bacterium GWA2_49_15]HAZ13504.1 hypothetical protein [Bdellovibrionales bacterium]